MFHLLIQIVACACKIVLNGQNAVTCTVSSESPFPLSHTYSCSLSELVLHSLNMQLSHLHLQFYLSCLSLSCFFLILQGQLDSTPDVYILKQSGIRLTNTLRKGSTMNQ